MHAIAWMILVVVATPPAVRRYDGPGQIEAPPEPNPPASTAAVAPAAEEPAAAPSTPAPAPTPERSPRREQLRERWSELDRVFGPTALIEADYRQRADRVEGRSGFAMARARLGLRLTPTDWMTAIGTVEFVADTPYLLDGRVTFTPLRWLEVSAGYSKPPLFASFRHEPVHALSMPMRSSVVNEMRIRRDVGAEARFRPHRAPIEAIVRLGNGVEGVRGNDNDTPTGYAALDLVLGRAWVAGKHQLLGLRLGAASLLDDAGEHDGIAGRTPLGYTYAQAVSAEGLRSITEAHVIGYAGPLRMVVEGAYAYESRSEDDDDATAPSEVDAVRSWGLTGEVAWSLRGTWRKVGRQPSGPGDRGDRWDRGALELTGRVDRQWLGRGTSQVANAGGTTPSLALKWWATSFLALCVYGDATRFDTPPLDQPTRTWSWSVLVRGSFFWGDRIPLRRAAPR